MLKTSVVVNTWACDNCGLETVVQDNPYFQISIQNNTSVISYSGQIDLCNVCISLIPIQTIIDYVSKINLGVL